MASLNRVEVIGNVGRDPEMRYTPSGTAVTTFSVAANHNRRVAPGSGDNGGEWVSEATWFRITCWAEQAERAADQLRKGKQVFVEGRIRTYEYDKDGAKHYGWEVIASRFLLLGRREEGDGAAHPGDAYVDAAVTAQPVRPRAAAPREATAAEPDIDDIAF